VLVAWTDFHLASLGKPTTRSSDDSCCLAIAISEHDIDEAKSTAAKSFGPCFGPCVASFLRKSDGVGTAFRHFSFNIICIMNIVSVSPALGRCSYL
jgi:hypothetical protein